MFVGGVLDFWPDCPGIRCQRIVIYCTWDCPRDKNKTNLMGTEEEELA
jgi:hypothetical protein